MSRDVQKNIIPAVNIVLSLAKLIIMPDIQQNISLKKFNTFGIDVSAKYFSICQSIDDITGTLKFTRQNSLDLLVLSGGSNVLFVNNYPGMVLHPLMKGISTIKEDEKNIWLEVMAGEDWDDFVEYTVRSRYHGIENLSLIPGFVGTSPVQNIGAYGVEVSEVIEEVRAINLGNLQVRRFQNPECEFSYRDSIFKSKLKGRVIITSVVFRLSKKPVYNINYAPVKEAIEKSGKISQELIRKTIIDIREKKLPNPEKLGNAGSFFKNPVVTKELFEKLVVQYPSIPSYNLPGNKMKIPAAWLIEKSGWKGKQDGDAGVHENQPLVLVNHGKASGKDIIEFAGRIQDDVNRKFNIYLEPEVNIIGN